MSSLHNEILHTVTNSHAPGISISVSAPGKVILHGEHSVVFGKLAIAAAIDLRTYVTLVEFKTTECNSRDCVITFEGINCSYSFNLNTFKSRVLETTFLTTLKTISNFNFKTPELIDFQTAVSIIQTFIREELLLKDDEYSLTLTVVLFLYMGLTASVDCEIQPFTLTANSDIKPGSGVGSSAAFSVCVAATLLHYLKLKTYEKVNVSRIGYRDVTWTGAELSKFSLEELDVICRWAYQAECLFHGTPSGIDNTICTYGSLLQFRKGIPPVISEKRFQNLKLLLINTNVQRQTKVQVAKVMKLKETYPGVVEKILDAMDILSQTALEHILALGEFPLQDSVGDASLDEFSKKFKNLEILVDMNHKLLSAIGVSHPKLEEVCTVLSDHNLHGKLTGAGGGGNAICYIPPSYPKDLTDQVIDSLKCRGFDAFFVSLGCDGVCLESSDV